MTVLTSCAVEITRSYVGSDESGALAATELEDACCHGAGLWWERYVSNSGQVIGMSTFWASAPLKGIAEEVWVRTGPGGYGRKETGISRFWSARC